MPQKRRSDRWFVSRTAFLLAVGTLVCLVLLADQAQSRARNVCDDAARQAARESGVPISVLMAITRTETGRRADGELQPWPWTVNMQGAGHWFDTATDATGFVHRHRADGAESFDVGCFQINYRWHGRAFASIEQMFDPLANARYAARFLKSLHVELGSWAAAAGAYHSRTPELAARYVTRFNRIHAALGDPIPQAPAETATQRTASLDINDYPLLKASDRAPTLGSLVPLGTSPGPGLLTRARAALGG